MQRIPDLKNLDSLDDQWEKYSSVNQEGQFFTIMSSKFTEIPICRAEFTSDGGKNEPNYKLHSYGRRNCCNCKERNQFFRTKRNVLFFITHYMGLLQDFKSKVFVIGYLIPEFYKKTYCVKSFGNCFAFKGDQMKFVRIEDAIEINQEMWEYWGFEKNFPFRPNGGPFIKGITSKTYSTGIKDSICSQFLDFFDTKDNAIDQYIAVYDKVKKQNVPIIRSKLECSFTR